MRRLINGLFFLTVVVLFAGFARAQDSCAGPVYSWNELTHKAKIGQRDWPLFTKEALAHDVHGRVVLEATLCYTGKVTEVQVLESLPYGLTESAVESARSTK